MDELQKKITPILERQGQCIGYPANLAYDYSPLVKKVPEIFSCKWNNVGPVDTPSNYAVHTKDVEKRVLQYFCNLWRFDVDNVWGYVTSSGTEGNEQALYIARELFPNAVFYFSRESHYSIKKIAKILKLPYEEILTTESGEIDYADFEQKLMSHLDVPAIVNANLGTTMKGAYDNTREIYRIIRKHKMDNRYFLHADGALMGVLLPLFEKDLFFKRYIHSISISGHKFFGVPFPCGIVMVDTSNHKLVKNAIDSVTNFVEYIDCTDCTISGSRSGVAPLFLDYIISVKQSEGFTKDAAACIENAEYLVHRLNDLDMDAWRNNNSIIVVLKKPQIDIVKKWQLASEGDFSHVVVLPHVTKKLIEYFISDLREISKTAQTNQG